MKKKDPSRKTKVRKTEKTTLPADSTPTGLTDYEKDQLDLQTHSALLELASDAVLVRDLEGSIQLWNRGAERMYGWTKDEVLGKKIYELLQTSFPAPAHKIHQDLLRHGYWEGELIHTRKDGEQRYVESRWFLHRRGDWQSIFELNTDITDRKRYQDQLRQLSAQLMHGAGRGAPAHCPRPARFYWSKAGSAEDGSGTRRKTECQFPRRTGQTGRRNPL